MTAAPPRPLPNPSPAPPHLVDVDGDVDDDVEQVAQSQAGDENVGAVPHALVLVDDPQQRGVADDAHDEDGAGHDGVDVLEDVADVRGPGAHGQQGRLRGAAPGAALREVGHRDAQEEAGPDQAVGLLLAEHLEGHGALLEGPWGLAVCPREEAAQENGQSGGSWDRSR